MSENETTITAAPPESDTAGSKVISALKARPGGTVAEIAAEAGVGRSTAGKILAAAEQNGTARRTPGSVQHRGRTPDRWEPAPANNNIKPARLRRGALRTMVADFLTAHPTEEFGPTAIGNALQRSSGAIANALTKLVIDGHVIQTNEHPARYAAATTGQSSTTG